MQIRRVDLTFEILVTDEEDLRRKTNRVLRDLRAVMDQNLPYLEFVADVYRSTDTENTTCTTVPMGGG